MKYRGQMTLLTVVTIAISGCVLTGPNRHRIKEVSQQVIPKEILNTYWTLESFDDKPPDCNLTIGFLDKGQFIIKFKNEILDGNNLWYIVNGSEITIHTRPLEKIVWTSDNCEINPASFALTNLGHKVCNITNDKLILVTFDKKEFIFRKV